MSGGGACSIVLTIYSLATFCGSFVSKARYPIYPIQIICVGFTTLLTRQDVLEARCICM